MKNNHILTVGSMAFDSIQTPAGKADGVLGGSANYFSLSASFFASVQIVAVVGEDFPKSHLDTLATKKIDVSGVEVRKGKTFHWVGQYDQNLNEAKTLSTFLNVFEHFDPKLSNHHQDANYVFLANIDPVLQQKVLTQVKSPALIAADSMNFWITGKPEEVKKTLRHVDVLSINEGEAYLLSGQKNLARAAQMIRDMGPSVVIIKRGEYGAACFTGTGTFLAPAFLVPTVVDPTGAGDTFAGALVGTLAAAGAHRDLAKNDPKKWDQLLRSAVVNGAVLASFTVEDFSMHRLLTLTSGEIESRRKALIDMISLA